MLSEILSERRRKLQLSLSDIAKYLDVSVSTVSRWENGDIQNIRYDNIVKLAKILRIPPWELFDLSGLNKKTSTPTEKADVDDPLTTAIMTELRQIPKNEKELILSVIRSIADKYNQGEK